MLDIDGIRVTASLHAAKRAVERIPLCAKSDLRHASIWTERFVYRALRDGRRARTCPSWCIREWSGRGRAKAAGARTWFVWNEDENAVAVVERKRHSTDKRHVWFVVTVIGRREAVIA